MQVERERWAAEVAGRTGGGEGREASGEEVRRGGGGEEDAETERVRERVESMERENAVVRRLVDNARNDKALLLRKVSRPSSLSRSSILHLAEA